VASTPPGGSKGEILRSNVDDMRGEPQAPRQEARPRLLPILLVALLVFLLGVGTALLFVSSQSRGQQAAAATGTRTVSTPVPAAINGANNPLPDVNGISCDALESTVVHIHMHLAIFVNGQEEQIPFGIGIGEPWQVSDSDEGPFVTDGSCFYWIHTHTQDGVVHIESPIRRRFSLGDFFAVWQMTLNENQVGPAQGQVITYVNGQRSTTPPQDVTLLPHERVQLDVGGDVAPYQFDFPPGD
jgi:hypothetical protein